MKRRRTTTARTKRRRRSNPGATAKLAEQIAIAVAGGIAGALVANGIASWRNNVHSQATAAAAAGQPAAPLTNTDHLVDGLWELAGAGVGTALLYKLTPAAALGFAAAAASVPILEMGYRMLAPAPAATTPAAQPTTPGQTAAFMNGAAAGLPYSPSNPIPESGTLSVSRVEANLQAVDARMM